AKPPKHLDELEQHHEQQQHHHHHRDDHHHHHLHQQQHQQQEQPAHKQQHPQQQQYHHDHEQQQQHDAATTHSTALSAQLQTISDGAAVGAALANGAKAESQQQQGKQRPQRMRSSSADGVAPDAHAGRLLTGNGQAAANGPMSKAADGRGKRTAAAGGRRSLDTLAGSCVAVGTNGTPSHHGQDGGGKGAAPAPAGADAQPGTPAAASDSSRSAEGGGGGDEALRRAWEALLESAAKCLDEAAQPTVLREVERMLPRAAAAGISVKYGRKVLQRLQSVEPARAALRAALSAPPAAPAALRLAGVEAALAGCKSVRCLLDERLLAAAEAAAERLRREGAEAQEAVGSATAAAANFEAVAVDKPASDEQPQVAAQLQALQQQQQQQQPDVHDRQQQSTPPLRNRHRHKPGQVDQHHIGAGAAPGQPHHQHQLQHQQRSRVKQPGAPMQHAAPAHMQLAAQQQHPHHPQQLSAHFLQQSQQHQAALQQQHLQHHHHLQQHQQQHAQQQQPQAPPHTQGLPAGLTPMHTQALMQHQQQQQHQQHLLASPLLQQLQAQAMRQPSPMLAQQVAAAAAAAAAAAQASPAARSLMHSLYHPGQAGQGAMPPQQPQQPGPGGPLPFMYDGRGPGAPPGVAFWGGGAGGLGGLVPAAVTSNGMPTGAGSLGAMGSGLHASPLMRVLQQQDAPPLVGPAYPQQHQGGPPRSGRGPPAVASSCGVMLDDRDLHPAYAMAHAVLDDLE
ncbi:hypothetical protein MNEG_8316, partial [Monoraphidium neglectum]